MTHFTDIAWLAEQTRVQLEKWGWKSYKRNPWGNSQGICLFIAADRACTMGAKHLYPALGFSSLSEAMQWNDEQESVEAIYERLETLT